MSDKIKISSYGAFDKTIDFLSGIKQRKWMKILKGYGEMGVIALSEATPKKTGKTAASWSYDIKIDREGARLIFSNSNLSKGNSGPPVVVLLVYGHGTARGGYVQPNDFVTPTMKPIFDEIAEKAWKELRKK
jgi:hypothetical protein